MFLFQTYFWYMISMFHSSSQTLKTTIISERVKQETVDFQQHCPEELSPRLASLPPPPFWMILHFVNPLDNDTLWLPCNMPLGAYLAMWAVILLMTSLPVKNNTRTCSPTLWMAKIYAKSEWHSGSKGGKKVTSCDCMKKRKKTTEILIIKHLNETERRLNGCWLWYRSCKIAESHHRLTACSRAEASLTPIWKNLNRETRYSVWARQCRRRTRMAVLTSTARVHAVRKSHVV